MSKSSHLRAGLAGVALLAAFAAAAEPVAAPARDAAAAFVATQNFIVGRIGRDCLPVMKRSESARDYQAKWQKDNGRYYDAASKYMEQRLAEVGDPAERDRVEQGYYTSVQQRGMAAVGSLFKGGPEPEVCKYALTLIDGGSMNVDTMAAGVKGNLKTDLDALAAWAAAR